MKEGIVCLDLQTLFDSLYTSMSKNDEVFTVFSHGIRREANVIDKGYDYYFDLYENGSSNIRLCCDGEQCKVLERKDGYVRLISVENIDNEELEGIDTTFRLTEEEFNVATGGNR